MKSSSVNFGMNESLGKIDCICVRKFSINLPFREHLHGWENDPGHQQSQTECTHYSSTFIHEKFLLKGMRFSRMLLLYEVPIEYWKRVYQTCSSNKYFDFNIGLQNCIIEFVWAYLCILKIFTKEVWRILVWSKKSLNKFFQENTLQKLLKSNV